MPQSRQNTHSGVHAREQIGHGNPHLLGTTTQIIALACDAHQTANALDRIVIPRPVTVRASLTKACDAAINKSGVEGFQTGVIKSIAGHVANFEVLNEDVAVHHQFAYQGLAFWFGYVASE